MSFKDLRPRPLRRLPVNPKPGCELAVWPLCQGLLDPLVLCGDVVEYAVETHPDSTFMGGVQEFLQIGLIPQPLVHAKEVQSVIPVGGGFENRAEK